MTNNEIKNFFSNITDQIFKELEDDTNSKSLDLFFINMIKMFDEIASDGMDYIGSEDWDTTIESYKEDVKEMLSIEKKFSRESIHFLNTFSQDDMGEYIEFYPLDSHIVTWGSDGLKIISILTRNGILEVNENNIFAMSRDNYNLYKKVARMYDII